MLNIKDLQDSIHKHSIKIIQELQIIKMRIQVELKEDMSQVQRTALEKDLRRCDNLMDGTLSYEVMMEYTKNSEQLFKAS